MSANPGKQSPSISNPEWVRQNVDPRRRARQHPDRISSAAAGVLLETILFGGDLHNPFRIEAVHRALPGVADKGRQPRSVLLNAFSVETGTGAAHQSNGPRRAPLTQIPAYQVVPSNSPNRVGRFMGGIAVTSYAIPERRFRRVGLASPAYESASGVIAAPTSPTFRQYLPRSITGRPTLLPISMEYRRSRRNLTCFNSAWFWLNFSPAGIQQRRVKSLLALSNWNPWGTFQAN